MSLLLGCIADDFTGATDLANNLVRAGMRVLQTIDVPEQPLTDAVDAVVISLKSRTIEPDDAVRQSLHALQWLRDQGARQIYQKICSTFDSTDRGNIGPVADALMDALGTDCAIVCPAFPANARTVYQGHLFVGEQLLSDSGMRDHPLTPMTDANLVRVLQRQSRRKVGLIPLADVRAGLDAIRSRLAELRAQSVGLTIVDATTDEDLMIMGRAFSGLALIVAGSGVAIGLPQNHGIVPSGDAAQLPPASGLRAIVSGSCSVATNRQVQRFRDAGHEAFGVDPLRVARGEPVVADALSWAKPRLSVERPLLVCATALPASVAQVQRELGVERAGALVEHMLSAIARGLVEAGVRQLVVAGGETSGACVQTLGIRRLRVGPQIAPGVPWCHAASCDAAPDGLHLALKSGNFGGPDFFSEAFEALP
jgi:3-dehydrotetronate 4-kinase